MACQCEVYSMVNEHYQHIRQNGETNFCSGALAFKLLGPGLMLQMVVCLSIVLCSTSVNSNNIIPGVNVNYQHLKSVL